jgi:phosphoribosylamine--glycine ligase
MRILVVGSGGREHALVWKLAQFHTPIFCAPGNAGIGRIAKCVDIGADDIPELVTFAVRETIDLTVVGPEVPLVAGIADDFSRRGLLLFGPVRSAAQLEGNKGFAKRLMKEQGIPTAEFESFNEFERACGYVQGHKLPVVVKASGLAAGKGAVVCRTAEEAEAALRMMMVEAEFGVAGRTVVVEDFLEGEEVSFIGLCDGNRVELLPPSQDHKALLDGDKGPNTGGMGAYAPAPVVTAELSRQVEQSVFKPLLDGLRMQGIEYRGAIYAGLMLTAEGPKVLEFNCRFGDPETQAVMPLLRGDLGEMMAACALGDLSNRTLEWSEDSAVCVVAASRGYPGKYETGVHITGDLVGADGVIVFHAGTREKEGKIVTGGGRVFGVTGVGPSLREARERAYEALGKVEFAGMQYRHDIGWRGLARQGSGTWGQGSGSENPTPDPRLPTP